MSAAHAIVSGTGKLIKFVLGIALALIVLVLVVALVGLSKTAHESEQSAKQVDPAQFAALQIGTPASTVRTMFGKPQRTQVMELSGYKSSCWYYGVLAKSGMYQLCFENSKLSSKSRY